MRLFNQIVDVIIKALAAIGGLWLGFLLVSICYATFSRFFFKNPLSNLIEISAYGLLFLTFLASPWLLKQRGHISIDIFISLLGERNRARVNTLNNIVGFIVSSVIFYYGCQITLSNYRNKVVVMDSMHTPQYLLLMVIPIGVFFMAIQFLRNLKEDLYKAKKGKGET